MTNLDRIMDGIADQISEKEKVREEALHLSRDVVINCRKSIQQLHRSQAAEADALLSRSSELVSRLSTITASHQDIYHAGYVENATQEYVEARCLVSILQGADLPTPEALKVTSSAYLMGLCDVVGELRRAALDAMLAGNPGRAAEFLTLMDAIYDAIMRFDYPSGLIPIKKKQDVVRSLIEKTRGELVVASCEQRISENTREFSGLLSEVKRKPSPRKDTGADDAELDVDTVW